MEIITLPCGIIQTNAYIIYAAEGGDAYLIDAPDGSYNPIMAELKKRSLTLKAVLVSHGHWDHILDLHRFSGDGYPVWAHSDSLPLLKAPLSFIPAGLDFEARPVNIDRELKHGEELEILGEKLIVRSVPGHCPGSLACYFPDSGVCFTGDLIFLQSIGRTDLPGGDSRLLEESVRKSIYSLPDNTTLYPGHGSETSVGYEKHNNMFIQE